MLTTKGCRVGGIDFDALTEVQTVETVIYELHHGRGGWLVTPNIDILQRTRDAALRELVNSATLVVCDGMPVLWAARLAGTPLPERVTGSSLIRTLTAAAAREGDRVFLLGAAEGVAEQAAEVLNALFPSRPVIGVYSPRYGFERSPAELTLVIECMQRAAPDIVFCGFGFPKQEWLIRQMLDHFPGVWFVGCGGAIDMVADRIPRAPALLQRAGLEWAYRMMHEPRRLAKRYLVDDLPFAVTLLAGSIWTGMLHRAHHLTHVGGRASR